MKKGLKYTLVSLGSQVVLAGIGLGIMYVVSPYKVKVIAHYPFANGTAVEFNKTLKRG
nr:hypothetical protein [uncultured Prevotella sp.]